jgi:hypothetical protein
LFSITRLLAKQLRSVLRRAGIKPNGAQRTLLRFDSQSDGQHIRAIHTNVAIEHHLPGETPSTEAETLWLPIDALVDIEGSKQDVVTLETAGESSVVARWSDRNVPQMTSYSVMRPKPGETEAFPAAPESLAANEPALWQALRDALPVADPNSTRYALGCLHFRGERGQIASTDGRHILRQGGFNFGWTENLLAPAVGVLGCPELAGLPLSIGRSKDWLTLCRGQWQVHLRINQEGRFPKIDDVIRRPDQATARLVLSPVDAEFLADHLPRLPDHEGGFGVTVDLNGGVTVRARDEEHARQVELTLVNSSVTGQPMAVSTDRRYLANALRLGFREICFFTPEAPLVCDDGRRQYVWALLAPASVIQAQESAIRLESASISPPTTLPMKKPRRSRSEGAAADLSPAAAVVADESVTGTSQGNCRTADAAGPQSRRETTARPLAEASNLQADSQLVASPLAEAQALRSLLRQASAASGRLIVSLRRQNKKSRLVESTLAALKELKAVG